MDVSKTFLAVGSRPGFALEKFSIERERLKIPVQPFIEMGSGGDVLERDGVTSDIERPMLVFVNR